jgi:glycine hydroxymethyltransferase
MTREQSAFKATSTEAEQMLRASNEVRAAAQRHNKYFSEVLPMIASENILSPRALEMLSTDLHGRYAEGQPGKRYYQGCQWYDEIETKCTELAQRLFSCRYANVQSTSGTVSHMAVFKALASPGDTITATSTADGGHISLAKFGSAGLRGLKIHEYPFDNERMTVDPDGAARLIREVKPRIVLLGQSVFLFPAPIKEGIGDAAREVGAPVVYDGAPLRGLLAGGRFQ